jgi:hypothetical protein
MGLWRGVWPIGRRREFTFAALSVLVFFCFRGELLLLSITGLSSENMSKMALDPRLCRCDEAPDIVLLLLPLEDLMLVRGLSAIDSWAGSRSVRSFKLFFRWTAVVSGFVVLSRAIVVRLAGVRLRC